MHGQSTAERLHKRSERWGIDRWRLTDEGTDTYRMPADRQRQTERHSNQKKNLWSKE